ncbi:MULTISPECIES: hypothetical protein [unclassified Novosphingobium]|uniref:hypothetical protein n=1 Tax=unclassified Novosphingobium TaxID=2644732 RepID=UPI00146C765A|nr:MULTISPECIES: hypothetical protein [unclassified Novosphingobium]NMN88315.1 hypothetical protein [Novosphingobium sp. SG916]
MRPIIIVEDVFDIPGWGGLIVVPGPAVADGMARLEGPVSLRRPDGSTIAAVLKMAEVFQTPPPKERRWTCLLLGIDKTEVPIGSEVWPSE